VPARSNDNVGDQFTRRDAAQAQNHNGHAIELEELLRSLRAHARTEACSGKNGGYAAHFCKCVIAAGSTRAAQTSECTSSGGSRRNARHKTLRLVRPGDIDVKLLGRRTNA